MQSSINWLTAWQTRQADVTSSHSNPDSSCEISPYEVCQPDVLTALEQPDHATAEYEELMLETQAASVVEQAVAIALLCATLTATLVLAITLKPFFFIRCRLNR
ncbi:MAG: hypothetical protein KME20_00730 [Kaiparowitsia implicata GSE-PSE-MK54-09C]|jgi:hypothetical protein|nr:hypothetical protein [Kaiparowitsia implicata GSE-PSE-MK54-09C]